MSGHGAAPTSESAPPDGAVRRGGLVQRMLPGLGRPPLSRALIAGLATVVVFLCIYWPAYLQSLTHAPMGVDGYFHIKYTRILREQGPLKKLPWLYHTVRRDSFRDHHFLFHVLQIPFTYGDLRAGAKTAAWIFASAALLVFTWFAARRDPLLGLLAALLLLGAGSHFMFRMSLPRVMSLALLALIVGIHCAMARRYKLLALTAFLYVLLYDGAVLLLLFCALHLLVTAVRERRFEWRLTVALLAGFVLGYIVNPYFPENVRWLVFNVQRVAGGLQTEYPTGTEWQPVSTWVYVRFAPAVWGVTFLTVLLLMNTGRPSTRTVSLFLMAAVMVLFGMKSRRYILYWAPLCLLFSVHGLSDFVETMRAAAGEARRRCRPRLVAAAALVVMLPAAVWSARESIRMVEDTKPFAQYMGAAEWLEQHSEPGEIVFNVHWDAFPRLFFFSDKNYYVVGLDLLYLVKYDQGLYNLYRNIGQGNVTDPSRVLRERFNARYILGSTLDTSLVDRCDKDAGLVLRYVDPWNFVYEVKEVPRAGPSPRDPWLR